MWNLLEKPDTSMAAKIVSIISILFIVVSTVAMTLNTVPAIADRDENGNAIDNPNLAMIEAVCITWFTIEYLLRLAGLSIDFWGCDWSWGHLLTACFRRGAQKVGFSQRCNECDWCIGYPTLLCLNLPCRDTSRSRGFRRCQKDCSSLQVSTYCNLFSRTFSWQKLSFMVRSLNTQQISSLKIVANVLWKWSLNTISHSYRIMRILRIFKLARHSTGLQSIVFTVRNSYKELGLLILFIAMGVLIFSRCDYV